MNTNNMAMKYSAPTMNPTNNYRKEATTTYVKYKSAAVTRHSRTYIVGVLEPKPRYDGYQPHQHLNEDDNCDLWKKRYSVATPINDVIAHLHYTPNLGHAGTLTKQICPDTVCCSS